MDPSPRKHRSTAHRRTAQAGGWAGLVALALGAAGFTYGWAERAGFVRLDDLAARQLDLYAAVLENELGRHDYLPRLLETDGDIEALLRDPADAPGREVVNRRLTRFAVLSGVRSITVLDARGIVAAASDWYLPTSPIGQDRSATHYFIDATRGGDARTFPPVAVRGTSDFCMPQPVVRRESILGVVVACISLVPMESTWTDLAFTADSEKPFVVNERGEVIVAAVPAWRSKVWQPLPGSAGRLGMAAIESTPAQQTLGMRLERSLAHGARLVRLRLSASGPEVTRVLHEQPVPRFGWRLLLVSDPADVRSVARSAAWGAGAATAFGGVLVLYLLQRRRVVAQTLAARAALQQANGALEAKVSQRTAELQSTNDELIHEILERKHAEAVLKEAQDELVQAGKLALLGQLSTGISHELGQPLTALRALVANTRQLLARARGADALDNLDTIAGLVERMGRITAQLKSFARKDSAHAAEVDLSAAIDAALLLLQARIRAERVDVQVRNPHEARVRCDVNRLEQVLVNLMANALDAMHATDHKSLEVDVSRLHGRAVVRVTDSGPGLSQALRSRLFEPFFTTKPAGEGLGLGLVISANIVLEFGGTLRVASDDANVAGAAFEFDLELSGGRSDV